MSFEEAMNLDVNWKEYLLEKGNEWFEEYKERMENA